MKQNLEHNVLKLHKGLLRKDDKGSYIPFCTYHWHFGIIKDETKYWIFNKEVTKEEWDNRYKIGKENKE